MSVAPAWPVQDPQRDAPFAEDPFGEWIEAHRTELAQHTGSFVVVDLVRGILGAGHDPVELARLHDPDHTRLVHFVRPGTYAPVRRG